MDVIVITETPVAYTEVDPQVVALGLDPKVNLHLDRDPNDPRIVRKQKLVFRQHKVV